MVGLCMFCDICSGITSHTPIHTIRHLNLKEIVIGGARSLVAIYFIPISDESGSHIDTFVGFSSLIVKETANMKMQHLKDADSICTGLANYLKKSPERLMPHPELAFPIGVYISPEYQQGMRGMIREMVESKSGNTRTANLHYTLFEDELLERLNIINKFVCPQLPIRRHY